MLGLSLIVALGAAPVSVAVPGVACVGLAPALCESLVERFVAVLSEGNHVRAIAQKDIAQLLGLERQRQLIDCADTSSRSCVAELVGALGVDGVLNLSLTRSDPSFVVTARVIRSADGTQWVSATARTKKEGELFDALDDIAAKFILALSTSARPLVGVEMREQPGARWLPWAPGVVGGAAALVGAAVFLSAGTERDQLKGGALASSAIRELADRGRFKEQLGVGLLIGGGLAMVASAVWLVVTPPHREAHAWVAPLGDGAVVGVRGTWP